MKDRLLIVSIFVSVSLLLSTVSFAAPAPSHPNKAVLQSIIKLQFPFIRNEGQIKDERVYCYATTFAETFYVTKEGELVHVLVSEKKGSLLKAKLIGVGKISPKSMDPSQTKVNSDFDERGALR